MLYVKPVFPRSLPSNCSTYSSYARVCSLHVYVPCYGPTPDAFVVSTLGDIHEGPLQEVLAARAACNAVLRPRLTKCVSSGAVSAYCSSPTRRIRSANRRPPHETSKCGTPGKFAPISGIFKWIRRYRQLKGISFGGTNDEPVDPIPCKVSKIGHAIDNETVTLNRAQDGYVRFNQDVTKTITGWL